MRWPWSKPEKRESVGYTEGFLRALIAQASGSAGGDPSASWALETAAALYSRAFAAVKITGDRTEGVTASMMALVGRNLIRSGQSLHVIDVRHSLNLLVLSFSPSGSFDIYGGEDEADWTYRVTLYGPDALKTRYVPSGGVLHFRYSIDPARPWRGIGPLGWATDTGALQANLEKRLSEETGAPTAHLLPLPQDGGDGGEDDPLASLKQDIADARGRTLLVETAMSGWGEGMSGAPRSDWKANRIGADPPDAIVSLRSDSAMAVLSACGVPPGLASGEGTAQGAREDYRRFVMLSVEPLLSQVREELETKLETEIAFDLKNLWGHDLQGRAASFKAMVQGGMALEKAVAASGLMGGGE